jgi:hypothetical protein
MIQVQVGPVAGHEGRIGQARAIVLRRKSCDAAGRLHGLAQGLGTQIRGAGRTLALTEVHRDSHALVLVMLQGLYLAQANIHRQTEIVAGGRLRTAGARPAGLVQHLFDDLLHGLLITGKGLNGCHICSRVSGERARGPGIS